MTLRILDPGSDTARRVREAIEAKLPGARVEVEPTSPGHFVIEVVADAFRGLTPVKQHQIVYAAIAPLMQGDAPAVHAVDVLRTRTPD